MFPIFKKEDNFAIITAALLQSVYTSFYCYLFEGNLAIQLTGKHGMSKSKEDEETIVDGFILFDAVIP